MINSIETYYRYGKDRSNYIEYYKNNNGEYVIYKIHNYMNNDKYLIASFLDKFNNKISNESLIKYSEDILENYDIVEYYLRNRVFINKTITSDIIRVYKNVSNMSKVKINSDNGFEEIKNEFSELIKNWNKYCYDNFTQINNHLTYDNFYKKYLDIFDINALIEEIKIPTSIFENTIEIKLQKNELDKYCLPDCKRHGNELSFEFIYNNAKALKDYIEWEVINCTNEQFNYLKNMIGFNILYLFENKNNIFPLKYSLNVIKENIVWDYDEKDGNIKEIYNYYNIYNALNILSNYKYITSEIKYKLNLMKEIFKTCKELISESEDILKSKISIESIRIKVVEEYNKQIEELRILFNKIKDSIIK